MIRVVNRRKTDKGVYVGRPTSLGNPYSHVPSEIAEFRVGSREEAVERYKTWIREQLGNPNSPASKMFKMLVDFHKQTGELTLSCWCKPKACHADVIAKLIEESQ